MSCDLIQMLHVACSTRYVFPLGTSDGHGILFYVNFISFRVMYRCKV